MFFRFLLLFILIYLLVRLIQSFFRPIARQPYSSPDQNGWNGSDRKEGETFIQNNQNQKSKRIPKSEGEYIDYEDI
jgi:hypothetical protein